MGFGQSLSGLSAASQKLDIIGNNIANSGTVGFKSSTASFADVYVASSRIGLGAQVSAINQNFKVGNISLTGNQFDLAIDGERGMFRVEDTSGNVLYTRNGEFKANKEGFIVNAQGYKLTGYMEGATVATPVTVPAGNLPPKATNGITSLVNLNASETVIDIDPANGYVFSPSDPDSYHHSLPVTLYDSQGNPRQLTQYFTKSGQNDWTVRFVMQAPDTGTPMILNEAHTISFKSSGVLDTGGNFSLNDILVKAGIDTTTPTAFDPLNITFDYAGSTQFSGDFAYNFNQNGYPTGEYASMEIASDGAIVASYTNGETRHMGYLVLANFNNLQGLAPVGGNAWRETSESGQPILGTPGTNGMALVKGQAVEESNVDLGTELVNMIITQRTYQANAQSVTTQNEIMQTLMNMR